MKIPEMILIEDLFETVRYNQKGLPLYIQTAELADYPDMGASCHWHDDIEWVSVLSGKMCFYVNGTRFLLQPGDSLMVNFRQMHHLHSSSRTACFPVCFFTLHFSAAIRFCRSGISSPCWKILLWNICIFPQARKKDIRFVRQSKKSSS